VPSLRLPLAAALALTLAAPAVAHTGGEVQLGVLGGMAHVLSGFDHVLAAVAAGVWAARLGGQATWMAPLAFAGALMLAALVAWGGAPIPSVEPALVFSVIAFGAALALRLTVPTGLAVSVTAAFGLVHGYAHGAEIPVTDNAVAYGIGLVAATCLMLGAGLVLGRAGRAVGARMESEVSPSYNPNTPQ
jgi:urease accessory protein